MKTQASFISMEQAEVNRYTTFLFTKWNVNTITSDSTQAHLATLNPKQWHLQSCACLNVLTQTGCSKPCQTQGTQVHAGAGQSTSIPSLHFFIWIQKQKCCKQDLCYDLHNREQTALENKKNKTVKKITGCSCNPRSLSSNKMLTFFFPKCWQMLELKAIK